MTIGYPDWERRTQQAGQLYKEISEIITIEQYYGPYYTADWQSLFVFAECADSALYFRLQLSWADANPAVDTLTVQDTTFGSGFTIFQTLPVLGSWLTVDITPQNTAQTVPFDVWIWGMNGASQAMAPALVTQPSVAYDQSVAASSTVDVNALYVSPGPYTWALHHSGTGSWEAILQYWDWNATAWTDLIDAYGPDYGRGFIQRVSLPAAPVRLELTNSATTSATMKTSLIAG